MTRFTVDNMGEESTIEMIHTYPFSRERVELPDDLPEGATVEVTDVEEGTRVKIEFPVDAEKAVELEDLIKE